MDDVDDVDDIDDVDDVDKMDVDDQDDNKPTYNFNFNLDILKLTKMECSCFYLFKLKHVQRIFSKKAWYTATILTSTATKQGPTVKLIALTASSDTPVTLSIFEHQ